ncbi:MAG: TadE family protein [Chloroflexota bacterium]|nr:TadE family protein [Chloroflexota bacterium]
MNRKWRLKVQNGQSFVELTLILPVLLMLIAGLVEIGFYAYSYMTALQLTREAARFASKRDPFSLDAPGSNLPDAACSDAPLHFYFDTACIIIDTGFNPNMPMDTDRDDVTITVFTIAGDVVTDRWPHFSADPPVPADPNSDGVWSLSTASDNWSGSESWTKDCDGNVVRSTPFMTNAEIESMFETGAPTERGLVMVELWYCYEQVLGLPILSDFIPDPLRLHAYTIMPSFEAIPTPTPIP